MTPIKRGPVRDYSGTIAVNAIAQIQVPAQIGRYSILFQNVSGATMYINFGAAADPVTPGSIKLIDSAWYENPPEYISTDYISVYGATAGQKFVLKIGTGL